MTLTPAARSAAAPPTEAQIDSFYRSCALGLAWLDARESAPRRFGTAADASWRNYAGSPADLSELDRIELLLRDGASVYPDAFGPRAVFDLPGLTDDEPFGQWHQTPSIELPRDLFRSPPAPSADVRALLTDAARAWSLPLGTPSSLAPIGPTTRVLVVGAGALVEVAVRFAERRELSFHEQVFVAADTHAMRHLAGLAALALGELRRPTCVAPDLDPASPDASVLTAPEVLASSDDASTREGLAADAWRSARTR
ncbi:MAG: hypothetical protein U0326_44295 [Polyangiales bacterium]